MRVKELKEELKFKKKLMKLQIELTKLQEYSKKNNKKILFIFEGRDASGKGSIIKTITEYLNPRFAKVVALGVPSEKEKNQWYFQRYVHHLPGAGEIVFFDRSWYNRAMVEPVMGFCTQKQHKQFLKDVVLFEDLLKNSDIELFKMYFSITKETQQKRFQERKNDPLKHYKLSPVDLKAQAKWNEFKEAKDKMFRSSHTKNNPWKVIATDKKKIAKLNCIKYILNKIDYENKNTALISGIDPAIVKDPIVKVDKKKHK